MKIRKPLRAEPSRDCARFAQTPWKNTKSAERATAAKFCSFRTAFAKWGPLVGSFNGVISDAG